MKKVIVVGVVLLFLGITITPSIHLSVVKASTEAEYVDVTTEVCGIRGFGRNTVKLTHQQYQDLENSIVDLRVSLNKMTTQEGAVLLIKEAIAALNKYGVLPKEIKGEQITNRILKCRHSLIKENLMSEGQGSYENHDCLIVGRTTETYSRRNLLFLLPFSYPDTVKSLSISERSLFPYLCLGRVNGFFEDGSSLGPAEGWIWSSGSQGTLEFNGSFFGHLGSIERCYGGLVWVDYHKGITGFVGICMFSGVLTTNFHAIYLGYARHVYLDRDSL